MKFPGARSELRQEVVARQQAEKQVEQAQAEVEKLKARLRSLGVDVDTE
ncbi:MULTISPECIES: hypothetical protein [Nostocales]|nr:MULTISPECIES: hypothetical protein [Nostocales]